jgi:hypothetical protein
MTTATMSVDLTGPAEHRITDQLGGHGVGGPEASTKATMITCSSRVRTEGHEGRNRGSDDRPRPAAAAPRGLINNARNKKRPRQWPGRFGVRLGMSGPLNTPGPARQNRPAKHSDP